MKQNITNKLPYSTKQVVAWGDMDAFGHVNNVAYIRYFESARADYFSDFGIWTTKNDISPDPILATQGPVLIRVEMDYRKQVYYPNTLEVTLGLLSVAKKGFDIGCTMWLGEQLVAGGLATILWFDFVNQKVCLLPEKVSDLFSKENDSKISTKTI